MREDGHIVNNQKVIPFERNRYFYGKLLTVRDFEVEQRYFNDKRRLMNRLLLGPGILAGLNVLSVDDKTILVEPGVAIDDLGREIVVESPFISRLSVIEGFDAIKDHSEVYLNIAYKEESKEAVHNVSASEQGEYNRVLEGYGLSLVTEAPSYERQLSHMIESKKIMLVDNANLLMILTMPHCCGMSETYTLSLDIFRKKPGENLLLKMSLKSRFINYGQDLVLDFDESKVETQEEYHLEWHYDISQVAPQDDLIELKSFKLEALPVAMDHLDFMIQHVVSLDKKSSKEMIIEKFKKLSLDDLISVSANDKVCLAKLKILKTDKTYVIENVSTDPLNQLISNLELSKVLNKYSVPKVIPSIGQQGDQQKPPQTDTFLGHSNVEVNTGVITFDFKHKANARDKFFSEEISHDLGSGEVFIDVSIDSQTREGDANYGYQNQMVFGSYDIFEKSNYKPVVPNVRTGAICYKNKGTFRIGLQFLENYSNDELTIRWKATKVNHKYEALNGSGNQLAIEPAMAKIKTREKISFNVFYENEPLVCKWKIKEPNGGEIDENGVYMSPSKEGVYEIVAEIPERSETLSAYIIVENK